jgi:hypothetical protein
MGVARSSTCPGPSGDHVLAARIARVRLRSVQRRSGQGAVGQAQTDRADSIWLARITEGGSVGSSFVPPEPIRRLHTHMRYRRYLTQGPTAEKQRVGQADDRGRRRTLLILLRLRCSGGQ